LIYFDRSSPNGRYQR